MARADSPPAPPGSQDQVTIVAGAPGHAIVAWRDYRNGFLNADIYARRINIHSLGKPVGRVNKLTLDLPQARPAGREVAIRFQLPDTEPVTLEVFDPAGRRVRTLVARQELGAGAHGFIWDGADRAGMRLKRGVYLIRLRGERETVTRKFVILP